LHQLTDKVIEFDISSRATSLYTKELRNTTI